MLKRVQSPTDVVSIRSSMTSLPNHNNTISILLLCKVLHAISSRLVFYQVKIKA